MAASLGREFVNPRAATIFSRSLWALTAALVTVSVVALLQFWSGPMDLITRWTLGASLFALSCASVGAIIVRRHPRHLVGWLFTGIAIQASVSLAARHLAEAAVARGDLAGARWPALVMMVGISFAAPLVSMLLLLYPHGRLVTARWRAVVVLAGALLVLGALVAALTPFAAATGGYLDVSMLDRPCGAFDQTQFGPHRPPGSASAFAAIVHHPCRYSIIGIALSAIDVREGCEG